MYLSQDKPSTLVIDAREYEKSIEEFALAVVVHMQKHVPVVLNTLTEPLCVRTEVVCKAQLTWLCS